MRDCISEWDPVIYVNAEEKVISYINLKETKK
jgi:hypothetical protein